MTQSTFVIILLDIDSTKLYILKLVTKINVPNNVMENISTKSSNEITEAVK